MPKAIKNFNHFIWLLLAISTPLFSVSFLRLNLGVYHIPIPMIVTFCILLSIPFSNYDFSILLKQCIYYRLLLIFSLLIIVTHAANILYNPILDYTLREFSKIVTSILFFWLFVLFFPATEDFLKLFLTVLASSTAILLLALMYQYVIVFKAAYLGTFFTENFIHGKNHLAWFTVLILPYCLAALYKDKFDVLWISITTILITAIIYCMSRTGWITSFLILTFMIFFLKKDQMQINRKMILLVLAGVSLGVLFIMGKVDFASDLKVRAQTLYDPASLPETPQTFRLGKHSEDSRMYLMRYSYDRIKSAPLMGHGIGFPWLFEERRTHNDYTDAMVQTGLLGTIPFLIFLVSVAKYLFQAGTYKNNQPFMRAAQASFLAVIFMSNFINMYTSVHYWFFLALAMTVRDLSQDSSSAGAT